MSYENYYQTSDLSLAATLSFWWPIEQVDKTDPRRAVFYFESSPELLERVQLYRNGRLQVEPLSFFNQLKMVKSWLYERG